MGPFDVANVELFSALEWMHEQQQKYPDGNWDASIEEVEWQAW